MTRTERLHETHVCRDCGAEITIPYARVDSNLEGYWERAYWNVVPKLATLVRELDMDTTLRYQGVELNAAIRGARETLSKSEALRDRIGAVIDRWYRVGLLRFNSRDDGGDDLILRDELVAAVSAYLAGVGA